MIVSMVDLDFAANGDQTGEPVDISGNVVARLITAGMFSLHAVRKGAAGTAVTVDAKLQSAPTKAGPWADVTGAAAGQVADPGADPGTASIKSVNGDFHRYIRMVVTVGSTAIGGGYTVSAWVF